MHLSSQGLNFLGLTARKYETANNNRAPLTAVQQKLEAFEQMSNGFAQTTVALNNLKDLNCQAFCVIDGKKQLISEKSWDRGGALEGKVPLEEGIAKGLYHIEAIAEKVAEELNLDTVLAELKEKVAAEAASAEVKLPQAPTFKSEGSQKFKSKFDIKQDSAFKFIS